MVAAASRGRLDHGEAVLSAPGGAAQPPRLADFTTLRVGGPVRWVEHARTTDELVAAVTGADRAGADLLLLGGGSNLLVADDGFPGVLLRIDTHGLQVEPDEPGWVRVRVAAGESWEELVATSVDEGWSGLEALSGIPGSTGATPIQNVGAYGAEVAQLITSIDVLDRPTGQVQQMSPAAAGFAYRSSVLKREPGRWVVLSVTMRLAVDARSAPIRYAELARTLGVAVGDRAPTADVRAAVLDLRRGKGMVLDPDDHDTWSAGSFFTNPIVSARQADALPEEAPRFEQPDGSVKTSAAWLISHAGFAKGFRVRPSARAALSNKHVLALTNRGGATAEDLLELARAVRSGVAYDVGVVLENEPVLVGCEL